MDKLLMEEKFDGSVVARRQLTIQPGASTTVIMDRLENAKFLAVVAGYFRRRDVPQLSSLYRLRLRSDPQPFWRPAHAPHILIELYLGDEGIVTPAPPSS